MESTLTHPSSTAETANSLGAYVIRKRPLKSLQGIGFISMLWVRDALKAGLFSNTRSHTVASIIAAAGDCDGRYCFLYLASMVDRSGGAMSIATIKRAIKDLIKAGLVRKLNQQQARSFFAEELTAGKRWADRLPCVLELLIPASAYPEQTLVEINEARARLGEEPLDDTTRPYPSVGTTAQDVESGGSCCDTDTCSIDTCPRKNPGSVRGSVSTGEQNRQKARGGLFRIIDRIPNIFLADPEADRERLALAVEKLLRQGLGEADVRVLLSGLEPLRRPFPALMWRLRDMRSARQYLDGSLGRGIHGSGLPTPPWPVLGEDDPFAQPEQFLVDSRGQAIGTCPKHPTVRNVPGGTCANCGRLCRSVPNELMHEPDLEAADLLKGAPLLGAADLSPVEEIALDPELLGQVSASMNGAGRVLSAEPVSRSGLWLLPGSGPSPKSRAFADWARELIGKAPKPTDLDTPVPEQAKDRHPWRERVERGA